MAKIKPGNLTPVNPIVVPEVPPTDDVVFPKGTIQTMRPNATHAYGIPWSQISRWWSQFKQAATEWHIDPLELAAMAVIESSGQHYTTGEMTGNKDQVISRPDGTPVPSIGIMQVKPQYHQWRVPNVDAYTPLGNMVMSAAILAQGAQTYGSIDSAILNIYFPADDPNGTTQAAY
jgi:soluble lytic murein transglycosylase-like protein